jgi:hypothetical protein
VLITCLNWVYEERQMEKNGLLFSLIIGMNTYIEGMEERRTDVVATAASVRRRCRWQLPPHDVWMRSSDLCFVMKLMCAVPHAS